MIHGRQVFSYILDFVYGSIQYPSGWFKPAVTQGYFNDDEIGRYQKIFFDELLRLGFRRTYWQLVFPNQTAGLVKKLPPGTDGVDEYHVRFYSDGVIDCELEVNRFNGWHWVGPRKHGIHLLEQLLDNEMKGLPVHISIPIRRQFGEKPYTDTCIRKSSSH